MKALDVPVWEKMNLTIEEAAAYSNIGENTLRNIVNSGQVNFILQVGSKTLIKRKEFEQWNSKTGSASKFRY